MCVITLWRLLICSSPRPGGLFVMYADNVLSVCRCSGLITSGRVIKHLAVEGGCGTPVTARTYSPYFTLEMVPPPGVRGVFASLSFEGISLVDLMDEVGDLEKEEEDVDEDEEEEEEDVEEKLYSLSDCSTPLSSLLFISSSCFSSGARFIGNTSSCFSLLFSLSNINSFLFCFCISLYFLWMSNITALTSSMSILLLLL